MMRLAFVLFVYCLSIMQCGVEDITHWKKVQYVSESSWRSAAWVWPSQWRTEQVPRRDRNPTHAYAEVTHMWPAREMQHCFSSQQQIRICCVKIWSR
jgi:hypothetical protein